MPKNLVELLYTQVTALSEYLIANREVSFASDSDDSARKVLLLAAASYFEVYLSEDVRRFLDDSLKEQHPLHKVVRTKLIDRQYHTWFNWDKDQANQFFGMFGDEFKKFMVDRIGNDAALQSGIASFMELGRLRNELVHQNFADFAIDQTTAEIYQLYQRAVAFVSSFYACLADFTKQM